MHKLLATLALGMLLTATIFTTGCACTEEDEEECRTTHNSCVSSCDPLGTDYSGCVDGCEDDLEDCLDDNGCS